MDRPEKPRALELEIVNLDNSPDMPELFGTLAEFPNSCFLDSSLRMEKYGKHSFIGFDPYLVLKTRDRKACFQYRDGTVRIEDMNPFQALRTAFRERFIPRNRSLPALPPFIGGGIGYLSYELGRYIENLPADTCDDLNLPELAFCFFDKVISADLETGNKWLIVSSPQGEDASLLVKNALSMIEPGNSRKLETPPRNIKPGSSFEFSSGFTKRSYMEAVDRVKDYIFAGDIFQANLSQRFSAPLDEPAWDLYKRLRVLNAAPFSAFLNLGDFTIASSSPERFLRVADREVETRPIKGTRKRSGDPAEDELLKKELRTSEKDLAELSMIVDLERNDLGKVCEYGSVTVDEHAVLESYATVHHLVSTVTGKLHEGKDIVDLLRATFPGGSITGAPKIRSMEIIDQLEPNVRSIYTGSIGYLGYNGQHDTNIAIRTMIIRNGRAYFQVGGGIVADSDPEAEYDETLHKGRAIFQSLAGSSRVPGIE
ncbi:MAG: aminodeoxychorismate synthase component I [Actinobacteria bacterium]|nr:aminodeoxychorismate synthase component I [Actinomycetota bacterium]